MSYRHGRGDGGRWRRSSKDGRGYGYGESASYHEVGVGRCSRLGAADDQNRDRPPPHLRGREIGLWYARWGAVRRKQADRRSRAVVQMDEAKEMHITNLLRSVQSGQPGSERFDVDARASTSSTSHTAPRRTGHCYFDGEEPEEKKLEIKKEDEEEGSTSQKTRGSQRYFSQGVTKDRPPENWDDDDEDMDEGGPVQEAKDTMFPLKDLVQDKALDDRLKRGLQEKMMNHKYKEMLGFRKQLTAYAKKEEILELIKTNRVLLVKGETGCGKTTQVPQYILDDYINRGLGSTCSVVCTLPRRISAISVAERVAAERAESVGNGNSVGYQIRLQSRLPRKQGFILYCTTGIVLQWLRSDSQLTSVTHLILDEIHERNLQSDVLLIIVKDLLKVRPDLKVILMSATLNAERFSEFFGNVPTVHIQGLTFKVEEFMLEDVLEMIRYRPNMQEKRTSWKRGFMQGRNSRPDLEQKEAEYMHRWPDFQQYLSGRFSVETIAAVRTLDTAEKIDLNLIVELTRHIALNEADGAILIFLPGWDTISSLHDLLRSQEAFKSDRFIIIPLHSMMPTVNQTQVFAKPPPGIRKIIIATNIAESSITIDDVVFVINAGKVKETRFDTTNNMKTMSTEWVSEANSKQRKGRAGRVAPGKCYHLYSSLRASLLAAFQLPEIMRIPLEELCLEIKILNLGCIAEFLNKAMDPPSEEAIYLAINHLRDLNALDQFESLTALGHHLARLPVEPHIGKLILFGALLGCLDPVLTIAASLSFKDPFYIPLGKEKDADQRRWVLSGNSKSDHITIVNALQGWEDARQCGEDRNFCWRNFLSADTLMMLHNLKQQFAEHLYVVGFVKSKDPKDPASNIHSGNEKLLKAVIVAGLYPKVAMIRRSYGKRDTVRVYTQADGKVCIHPKSVNVKETQFRHNWLTYHMKMRTSSIFLYDCTEVSPYSLLFFGGDISIQKEQDQETVAVDRWIVFQCPARIAHLVKSLKMQLDSLLQEKVCNPAPVDWMDRESRDCAVITTIIDLVTEENTTRFNRPLTQYRCTDTDSDDDGS